MMAGPRMLLVSGAGQFRFAEQFDAELPGHYTGRSSPLFEARTWQRWVWTIV